MQPQMHHILFRKSQSNHQRHNISQKEVNHQHTTNTVTQRFVPSKKLDVGLRNKYHSRVRHHATQPVFPSISTNIRFSGKSVNLEVQCQKHNHRNKNPTTPKSEKTRFPPNGKQIHSLFVDRAMINIRQHTRKSDAKNRLNM
jgi:hypothetical protein